MGNLSVSNPMKGLCGQDINISVNTNHFRHISIVHLFYYVIFSVASPKLFGGERTLEQSQKVRERSICHSLEYKDLFSG